MRLETTPLPRRPSPHANGEAADEAKRIACYSRKEGRANKIMSTDTGNGACWICLEEGADGSGQPLRRDCSCRADNGFVHLSCLVDYAKNKSRTRIPGADKAWEVCPMCKQRYQNELALDLANEEIQFVMDVSIYSEAETMERDFHSIHALAKRSGAIRSLQQAASPSGQVRIEGK